MTYTIKQAAEITKCTEHTLRYYEKENLLHSIARDASGNRRYTDHDIDCIFGIICLKNTGMPIKDIKEFVGLLSNCEATLDAQRELVQKQKRAVEQKMQELEHDMERINHKLSYYDNAIKERDR